MHHIVAVLYVLFFWLLAVFVTLLIFKGFVHATILALIFLIVLAVVLEYLLYISKKTKPAPIEDSPQSPWPLIGGVCEVLDEITPTKSGYVMYRGEFWKAYSLRSTFKRGDLAYIIDAHGIYLIIEKEPPKLQTVDQPSSEDQ